MDSHEARTLGRVRTPWALLTSILVVAAIVRIPGLFTDLWLDEVWSLNNALAAGSWADILFRLKLDNNHHLNSLWLHGLGAGASPLLYRLLAFVSGVATVAAAYCIGSRESRTAGATTAFAFATSYLMVYYASEARGYAPLTCFGLWAWYFLVRFADRGAYRFACGFWLCSCLAMLAHPASLIFLIGAFTWYDGQAGRTLAGKRSATAMTLTAFAVPVLFFAAFWLLSLRGMVIGGGPPYSSLAVVQQTFSYLVGGPSSGVLMWITALAVEAIFVASLVFAYRRHDNRLVFYLAAGIVVPAIFVVFGRPPILFPRYFLLPAAVALLCMSSFVSHLLDGSRRERVVGIAMIVALATGCVASVLRFQRYGRGGYRDAVYAMPSIARGSPVTVSSSPEFSGHDFRAKMMVEHYVRFLGLQERVQYVVAEDVPDAGTELMIVESLDRESPESIVTSAGGHRFGLHQSYYAVPLVGYGWHLYRRIQ